MARMKDDACLCLCLCLHVFVSVSACLCLCLCLQCYMSMWIVMCWLSDTVSRAVTYPCVCVRVLCSHFWRCVACISMLAGMILRCVCLWFWCQTTFMHIDVVVGAIVLVIGCFSSIVHVVSFFFFLCLAPGPGEPTPLRAIATSSLTTNLPHPRLGVALQTPH